MLAFDNNKVEKGAIARRLRIRKCMIMHNWHAQYAFFSAYVLLLSPTRGSLETAHCLFIFSFKRWKSNVTIRALNDKVGLDPKIRAMFTCLHNYSHNSLSDVLLLTSRYRRSGC